MFSPIFMIPYFNKRAFEINGTWTREHLSVSISKVLSVTPAVTKHYSNVKTGMERLQIAKITNK